MSNRRRETESVNPFKMSRWPVGRNVQVIFNFDGSFYPSGGLGPSDFNMDEFFEKFDWRSWLVDVLVGFSLTSVSLVVLGGLVCPHELLTSGFVCLGRVFCFDTVSFYLVLLSCLIWVSLCFWISRLSILAMACLSLSIIMSILCYCCVHAIWFWVFYEMSIIPLLVLLLVESPYSERFSAGWYLMGYLVLSSLPMLLAFIDLSVLGGSYYIHTWGDNWVSSARNTGLRSSQLFSYAVLAVLFITKIPMPPFHVWLPIVHAEATSPVSVCLSGYIMKLGVLGAFRFCWVVLPRDILSMEYLLVCLYVALLFFMAATRELDAKRWLAFMSLAHIMVALTFLGCSDFSFSKLPFAYCLGHGLSAGLTFLFFWLAYDLSGTRNLLLLKSSISGGFFLRGLACAGLCTVCSLPPTVQFFSEVSLVSCVGSVSISFWIVMFLFIFFGGLVPLITLGGMLSRHCDVSCSGGPVTMESFSVALLVLWSFTLFFMV